MGQDLLTLLIIMINTAIEMKKILFAIMMLIPLTGMAQNTWETTPAKGQKAKTEKTKKKSLFEKSAKKVDPKYLAGAVPVVNGNVVFTLDKDIPGMSADQIYDKVRAALQAIVNEPNQLKEISKVAVDDKANHTVGARISEWLVFRKAALSLDQTVFNYSLIAKVSNGHLHLTLERIGYQYEMERTDTQGMETKAEEWITDEWGLNKKRTKLAKYSGKFRSKTIDRKDDIFAKVCKALDINY